MKTNVLVERARVALPEDGRGDAAYEFGASAWSQSRVQRPNLAIRAAPELHGLVSSRPVNWFRKDASGRFLWPGFSENSRVLAWIFHRCAGRAGATVSPIGLIPDPDAIDTQGLRLDEEQLTELFSVNADEWRGEVTAIRQHYAAFADRLPDVLIEQLEALDRRLVNGS